MAQAGRFRRVLGLGPRPPEPPALPGREELRRLVGDALEAQAAEGPELRPRDSSGLPGGLLLLRGLPTVLVPDLHARAPFLRAVLGWTPPGAKSALRDLVAAGEAQLVCLGDLFHTEVGSAPRRWREALREYLSGWAERRAMDEEMALCLAGARAVLECKIAYPACFHCLKGNHDNIADEEGHGDHPFYKFAAEGEMVASWFEATYGRGLLEEYRRFELGLPVLAAGERFVASHAEPAFALEPEDAVEYRSRPDVVEALIWTANDAAAPGSVATTLPRVLARRAEAAAGAAGASPEGKPLWFGGHRPVDGRYALRADGLYVQFHDPGAWRVAYLLPGRDPDPRRDILDVS